MSRACLGKTIVFICKWYKNGVSDLCLAQRQPHVRQPQGAAVVPAVAAHSNNQPVCLVELNHLRKSNSRVFEWFQLAPRMDLMWLSRACLGKMMTFQCKMGGIGRVPVGPPSSVMATCAQKSACVGTDRVSLQKSHLFSQLFPAFLRSLSW
eukprot:COSAG06_NODE_4125_length_4545_cov_30.309862_5_plen_151_part_00